MRKSWFRFGLSTQWCDLGNVSLLWTTVSSLLKGQIISQILSAWTPCSPSALFHLLSTAHVLAHPAWVMPRKKLEALIRLEDFTFFWRTFHSSNIIFLMWSLAASQILPAHGSVPPQTQLPYLLPQFLAGWTSSIPIRGPRKNWELPGLGWVCWDSHAAKRRASCDSVFVKC